jgi:hypothetical protein
VCDGVRYKWRWPNVFGGGRRARSELEESWLGNIPGASLQNKTKRGPDGANSDTHFTIIPGSILACKLAPERRPAADLLHDI